MIAHADPLLHRRNVGKTANLAGKLATGTNRQRDAIEYARLMLPGCGVLGSASWPARVSSGSSSNRRPHDQPIADSLATVGTVAKSDLGAFTVANDGMLGLPYVGAVAVAGKGPREAERDLAARFAATRKFQAPQVSLTLEHNARQ